MANLPVLVTFDVWLEPASLPSTGVTRLLRYYGRFRHLARPGLSLTGVRLQVPSPHQARLPVLRHVPCADMPSPIPRRNRNALRSSLILAQVRGLAFTAAAFPVLKPGRLPHRLFRGLLDVHCTLRRADSRSRHSRPSPSEASTVLSPPPPLPLLPAGAKVTGWVCLPLRTHAFSRRTSTDC